MSAVKDVPWAYGLLTAGHLALNAYHAHPWDMATKCTLAPFLIAWTLRTPTAPRALALALFFCLVGDLSLELTAQPGDHWFLGGMLAFAAAHVHFIGIFLRQLKGGGARLGMYLPPVTAVAVALVNRTWNGLEPDLRIPVMVYGGMLGLTTVTALATGNAQSSIGAAVFLVSDAMILLDVSHDTYAPKPAGLWIMSTYAVAIYLLTAGVLKESQIPAKAPEGKRGTFASPSKAPAKRRNKKTA